MPFATTSRRRFAPVPLRRALAAALLAAGVLAAAPVVPSCAAVEGVSTESRQYFEDARKRLEAGNRDGALIQLRNAVQADPDNWSARRMLGRLYLEKGEVRRAEKELSRAHEARPEAGVALDLARARAAIGDLDSALEVLPARDAAGDKAEARDLLAAEIQLGLDRSEAAEAALKAILGAQPLHADGNFLMARVALSRGDTETALDKLATVLDVAPKHLDARLLQSRVALSRGEVADALDAANAAVRAHPQNPRAQIAVARALLARSRAEEAEQRLDRALALQEGNVEALYLKAVALTRQNEFADAEAVLSRISERVRGYDQAKLLTGLIKLNTGQLAQARSNLQGYLSRYPDDPRARRLLAVAHLRDDNPQGTVDTLQDHLAGRETPDPQLLRLLASAQMRVGDTSAARATYARLAETGQGARASTNAGAMSRLLDEELRAETDMPPAVLDKMALAFDQLSLGEYDKAAATAEALVEAHPETPAVHNLMGVVRLSQGDEAAARESFETVLDLAPEWSGAVRQLERLDIRAGDEDAALARAEAYLDSHPEDVGTAARVARYRVRAGDAAGSRAVLSDLVARTPDNDAAHVALVHFLSETDQRDKALAAAERFAEARRDDAGSLMRAVRLHAGLNDRAGTRAGLERVIELAPERVDARLLMGRLERREGNLKAAETQFEKAAEVAPGNYTAVAELASARAEQGDKQGALKAAEHLMAERSTEGRRLKARVLERFGQPAEAERVLKAAFAEDPSAPVAHDLFQLRVRQGEREAAMAELRDWIADRPADVTGHLLVSDAQIRAGDYAAAERTLSHAAAHGDGNAVLLNNLAWLRQNLGDPRAIRAARQAYQLAPNDPRIADTLAWIWVQDGEVERALPLLREVHQAVPDNAQIRYHLAVALHRSGDTAAAREVLAPALDSETGFPGREDAKRLFDQIARK